MTNPHCRKKSWLDEFEAKLAASKDRRRTYRCVLHPMATWHLTPFPELQPYEQAGVGDG